MILTITIAPSRMPKVSTGVQRAFGAKLRSFLGNTLRNRFKAFLAGIGVTAILQSSTATGLMVTGFVAGGLVDLTPALAVMLGSERRDHPDRAGAVLRCRRSRARTDTYRRPHVQARGGRSA